MKRNSTSTTASENASFHPTRLTPEQLGCLRALQNGSVSVVFWTGAKRSGKTVGCLLGLVELALRNLRQKRVCSYIIGGVTIGSVKRNVGEPLRDICRAYDLTLEDVGGADPHWLVGGLIRFYYFGGETVRAYRRVRGLTAHSALIDEATLVHPDFISEVNTRLSFPDSVLLLSTNKDSPNHPLRTQFDHMESGLLKLESSFWSNPFFSDERRQAIIDTYGDKQSADYKRDILNEWAPREGLVFPIVPGMLTDDQAGTRRLVAVDPGVGTTTAALLFERQSWGWSARDEYYYTSRNQPNLSDSEHLARLQARWNLTPKDALVVDSASANFKVCCVRAGFVPLNAKKEVLQGIKVVNNSLVQGTLKICRGNTQLLRELDTYVWVGERPRKQDDHLADCLRYGAMEIFAGGGVIA